MATQKKEGAADYEVVLDNGLDFAVRRVSTRAANASELLVIMPSQGQYYIKNMRTERLSKVSLANMEGFFDSLYVKRNDAWRPRMLDLECSWLSAIGPNKEVMKAIESCLEDERFVPSAKTGRFRIDDVIDMGGGRWSNNDQRLSNALERTSASWRFIKSYAKTNPDASEEEMKFADALWPAVKPILAKFGLDDARKWAKAMWEERIANSEETTKHLGAYILRMLRNPITPETARVANASEQSIHVELPQTWGDPEAQYAEDKGITFDFRRLLDYTTKTLVKEGFQTDPDSFWSIWYDTLALQATCYDRIVDKYPEYLRSTHQALSAMAARMTFKVDPKQEAAAVARMAEMDWKPQKGDYLVRHPEKMDDLRIEAQEQSNCLASYIDSVARGDTQIMFLRRKDNPDHAHVTIEVDMERRVVQALGRFNQEPEPEAWLAIERWAKARDLDTGPVATHIPRQGKEG